MIAVFGSDFDAAGFALSLCRTMMEYFVACAKGRSSQWACGKSDVPTDHMEEPAQAEATILIFDAVRR